MDEGPEGLPSFLQASLCHLGFIRNRLKHVSGLVAFN